MTKVDKQQVGFKFGKYRTELLRECQRIEVNGRTYRLVLLRIADGTEYYSIRLYNQNGRFIKQLMFEPTVLKPLADAIGFEWVMRQATELFDPAKRIVVDIRS